MRYQVSKVVRFIDGDTFKAKLCGYDEVLSIRVYGIDCPELKGQCNYERQLAATAAAFTKQVLQSAEVIVVSVQDVDVYDRVVCHVFCDGKSLRKLLINRGLARVYEGFKRNWCR